MLKHTIARRALTTSRATSSVRKTISAVFVGLLVLCLASPSAALDLKLTRRMATTISGAWVLVPSASRSHLGYASVLASYAANTPHWLKQILQ